MMTIKLPKPAAHQLRVLASDARFALWCAGRRTRKTSTGIHAALCGRGSRRQFRGALQGACVWWVSSSFPVASSVWRVFRATLEPIAVDVSEGERRIVLPGGGTIAVKSAQNPGSLIGSVEGIDGVVLDEHAKQPADAWGKSIRPALSDTRGWALFLSTPEGHNHFKALFDAAEHLPDWERFHDPSTSNPYFDPDEIQRAREGGMPEDRIESEFLAKFVIAGFGRTYPAFVREIHVRAFDYDPALPLGLAVNFKVSPPAWLITQGSGAKSEQPARVLAEIDAPPGDTSVRAYLAEFRRRFPGRRDGTGVSVYGDASPAVGGKGVGVSDYEQIRAALPRAQHFIRHASHDEKDLVNAVNLRLRDTSGNVGAYVHPSCARTLRDLEFMRNAEASFRVDHATPGLGHYARAWAVELLRDRPLLAPYLTPQEEA